MAQPYDYSINIPNPVQGFLGGLQVAQEFRKQQQAQAQAEQQRQRALQFQQRVAQLQTNPSPDAIDKLYFDFPEMKEQLDVFASRVSDKDKRTYGDFTRRAILARQAGSSDNDVAAIYQQGAEAAKAGGRMDLYEQFTAAAKTAANPAGGDDLAARLLLKTFDPTGYDVIYQQSEITGFQKDLMAAGIDPKSPRGRELSENFAVNKADPLVDMPVPPQFGGGQYRGPYSGYIERFGTTNAPPKQNIPTPKNKDEFDALTPGAEFVAPDGSIRRKPMQGGQTVAPSGNFRGQ